MACASDCPANSACSGHVPVCSNTYTFNTLVAGSVIRATDITQLETAINQERTNAGRRYASVVCPANAFASYPFSTKTANVTTIQAAHVNLVTSINNQFKNIGGYGSTSTLTVLAGGVIYASDMTYLQGKVNESRNVCICDSACSCNIDCGCNGECSDDGYYYYP